MGDRLCGFKSRPRHQLPESALSAPGRRSQVVKAEVCKTSIRRFESARRLQINSHELPSAEPYPNPHHQATHPPGILQATRLGAIGVPTVAQRDPNRVDKGAPVERAKGAERRISRGGGTVDAADLKSATFAGVWVRVPPPAPCNLPYPELADRLTLASLMPRYLWVPAESPL